jgi:hypothetical protein
MHTCGGTLAGIMSRHNYVTLVSTRVLFSAMSYSSYWLIIKSCRSLKKL